MKPCSLKSFDQLYIAVDVMEDIFDDLRSLDPYFSRLTGRESLPAHKYESTDKSARVPGVCHGTVCHTTKAAD